MLSIVNEAGKRFYCTVLVKHSRNFSTRIGTLETLKNMLALYKVNVVKNAYQTKSVLNGSLKDVVRETPNRGKLRFKPNRLKCNCYAA